MTTTWTKVGENSSSWTGVPKAQFASIASGSVGEPIGLLLALTYATSTSIIIDPWTDISKASGASWTKIAKAT